MRLDRRIGLANGQDRRKVVTDNGTPPPHSRTHPTPPTPPHPTPPTQDEELSIIDKETFDRALAAYLRTDKLRAHITQTRDSLLKFCKENTPKTGTGSNAESPLAR